MISHFYLSSLQNILLFIDYEFLFFNSSVFFSVEFRPNDEKAFIGSRIQQREDPSGLKTIGLHVLYVVLNLHHTWVFRRISTLKNL